jgi:uncharacterized protein (TIGR03067 family)
MRHVLPLLIVLSLGFAPAPVYREKRDPAKDDLKALQGEWECVGYSINGEEPSVGVGKSKVVHLEDRLSCLSNGAVTARYVVVLNPSKEPKWIDLKDVDVPGRAVLGIYRLDGNTLTCAFRNQVNTKERPKEFRPHPLMIVEVFHRKKP